MWRKIYANKFNELHAVLKIRPESDFGLIFQCADEIIRKFQHGFPQRLPLGFSCRRAQLKRVEWPAPIDAAPWMSIMKVGK